MLAEILLALLQTVPSEEIVVSGSSGDVARRYVESVAPSIDFETPFARFYAGVCVGVSGLPAEANQVLADRIGEIASSVNLRVGEPGCAPNLLVLFVADGKAAARKLRRTTTAATNGQTIADLNRIAAEPGSARAWIEVETRSRDGDRPNYAPNTAPELAVSTSSRLSSTIRRDILSATVLIDRDAVAERNLRQVADYAAMRALTGARSRQRPDQVSILSTFTPDWDHTAPAELTPYDLGYLKGLYSGNGNELSGRKRQAIVRDVVREKTARP